MARTATSRTTAGKQSARKATGASTAKSGLQAKTTRQAKPASKPAPAAHKASPTRRTSAAPKAKMARATGTASKAKTAAKQARQQAAARPAGGAKSAAHTTRRDGPASRQGLASRKPAAQQFAVSHHQEADFKTDGLRSYALYRDLGIAAATEGLCQAHVIRFLGPCTDAVRKRHYHDTELQLVYVLKGWIRKEFAGHGEQLMQAGSCWLQPPGIEHTVLDFSDDCEVLEIIVPADFNTVELSE